MRYLALATDYDGTLAHDGQVEATTLLALERLRESGRRLILVTGREVDDLLTVFPPVNIFDRVVAENGGVLYDPATRELRLLAEPPPRTLIESLKKRAAVPISVGRVMLATVEPHDRAVHEAIAELGLKLQVILNKGSVMVLPTGVDKATGLAAALRDLEISARATVGVGDAENDQAFLSVCGLSVAVADALPAIRRHAQLVTAGENGRGVEELVAKLLDGDLPG